MKKTWFIGIMAGLLLTACGGNPDLSLTPGDSGQSQESGMQDVISDEEQVRELVEEFGKQLQHVSLLAPKDQLEESLREHYSGLVSDDLIERWLDEPANAPGRLVSSPWPDRIEISSVSKSSETAYEVQGAIIEITSEEANNGGAAVERPVTLRVEQSGDRWLIVEVVFDDDHSKAEEVAYTNDLYGFQFDLPSSWDGYTIVTTEWEGRAVDGPQAGEVVETGPLFSIRHPNWTEENPRQDIPIMILTIAQWDSMQQGDFHIGAAPIGPKELGRNSRYVFALPARYNFAFPEGYEEVETILENNPLRAKDVS